MATLVAQSTLSCFRPAVYGLGRNTRIYSCTHSEDNETKLSVLHANNLYSNEEHESHDSTLKKIRDFKRTVAIRTEMLDAENKYLTEMAKKHALCLFK